MKIIHAVFQCKDFNYIETVESIDADDKDIIIFGKNENTSLNHRYFQIKDKTLAFYKNEAIKYAIKNKYDYIFLIENDIVIKNNYIFFFKQKTAYEIYQCDWSSDVCSSDL